MMLARSPLVQPGQVRPTNPNNFAVPNGLVGYWGLDPDCLDFTNNLALDLSGQGNNGTLNTLPVTALRSGQIGSALSFDGAASNVNVGSFTPLYTGGNVTFAVWINPASFPNTADYTGLLTYGKLADMIFSLSLVRNPTTNKYPRFEVQNSVGSYQSATAAAILTGAWYHIVGVLNGSAILIYVNAVATSAAYTGTPKSGDSTYTVNIGRDKFNNNASRFLSGLADDARLYNRALDPWEIIQLYQAGLAGRR